jgi:electron transfer flavoprotein alpha subunit
MLALLSPFLASITARIGKVGIQLIIIAALLAGAALFGYLAARQLTSIITDRVSAAVASRDTYWQGEIEKANALADKKVAEQTSAAMKIQAATTDQVTSAVNLLAELKVKNAQLPPRPDCGLSVERGQLLPD